MCTPLFHNQTARRRSTINVDRTGGQNRWKKKTPADGIFFAQGRPMFDICCLSLGAAKSVFDKLLPENQVESEPTERDHDDRVR